ncbi:MAG: MGMT family protein [Candidatus Pacearchaeota archaeon]|nr:MGMT family protein [Candidatus Pacearchaeota archaeon]
MNSFNKKCYEILKKVPKGKITTYKEIAKALKSKAYRAVGNAMNKNPYSFAALGWAGGKNLKSSDLVPCYRVINSNGNVGGFASGTKNKVRILKSEGVEIVNNKINLKKYLFKLKN